MKALKKNCRFQSANNRVFNSENARLTVWCEECSTFQSANNRVFNSEGLEYTAKFPNAKGFNPLIIASSIQS